MPVRRVRWITAEMPSRKATNNRNGSNQKRKFMKIRMIAASLLTMAFCAGCAEEPSGTSVPGAVAPGINAEIVGAKTRTCIDPSDVVEGEKVPVRWSASDELGAFSDGGSLNVKYTIKDLKDDGRNASFSTTSSVKGGIAYAYYPYSSENDGKAATALTGTIPSVQGMDGNLYGDYKYGELEGGSDETGYSFRFHDLFSMVYFKINPEGTALAGETLESVTLSVTRNGADVPVTGDFTFNAVEGTYEPGETSNVLNTTWNKPLSGTLTGFATIFSKVEKDDKLNFTFKTTNYEATLTVTSGANFQPGAYYAFPLTLAKFKKLEVKKTIKGTFTAATYNVDGLPQKVSIFTINGDGPGSTGTTNISKAIAADDWDFIGFSEDFAYHTELTSSLSAYTFGKYRGNISASALYSTLDTDGLGFATKSSTCSFSNETIIQFEKSSGGLSSGANTCIKKGIRHYVVTLNDGTELDVIITHMNTYSSSGTGHINAQHAQLTQIAEYINSIRGNGRPIIFMGDTNCRYTRHDFQTYFWGKLDSDLVAIDPWVTYQWNGVYPTYPSNSLMVSDATGTSDTDIICENTQKGEVVDKIIYINNPGSDTQINALNYLRDYDGYNGLADHMPIVVDFEYIRTVTVN